MLKSFYFFVLVFLTLGLNAPVFSQLTPGFNYSNGLNPQLGNQPGQNPTNTYVDTTTTEDTVKAPKKPFSWKNNPKVATLASLIIPGGGQFYNKKYWKIPLVWTVLIGAGYLYVDNNTRYNDFRNSLVYYQNKIPDERLGYADIDKNQAASLYSSIAERYPIQMKPVIDLKKPDSLINVNTLVFYREQSKRTRDYMMIAIIVGYVLNLMDAAVDAHFTNFDVSDNLSMNVRPSMTNPFGNTQMGMSLTFDFVDARRKKIDRLNRLSQNF
jgi:hypothetical protein